MFSWFCFHISYWIGIEFSLSNPEYSIEISGPTIAYWIWYILTNLVFITRRFSLFVTLILTTYFLWHWWRKLYWTFSHKIKCPSNIEGTKSWLDELKHQCLTRLRIINEHLTFIRHLSSKFLSQFKILYKEKLISSNCNWLMEICLMIRMNIHQLINGYLSA